MAYCIYYKSSGTREKEWKTFWLNSEICGLCFTADDGEWIRQLFRINDPLSLEGPYVAELGKEDWFWVKRPGRAYGIRTNLRFMEDGRLAPDPDRQYLAMFWSRYDAEMVCRWIHSWWEDQKEKLEGIEIIDPAVNPVQWGDLKKIFGIPPKKKRPQAGS